MDGDLNAFQAKGIEKTIEEAKLPDGDLEIFSTERYAILRWQSAHGDVPRYWIVEINGEVKEAKVCG